MLYFAWAAMVFIPHPASGSEGRPVDSISQCYSLLLTDGTTLCKTVHTVLSFVNGWCCIVEDSSDSSLHHKIEVLRVSVS